MTCHRMLKLPCATNVDQAWPSLEQLGLGQGRTCRTLRVCQTARAAVEGAAFIQENVPERLAIKHGVYAEIEPALAPGAIVATSASGLTLSEMQAGWQEPCPLRAGPSLQSATPHPAGGSDGQRPHSGWRGRGGGSVLPAGRQGHGARQPRGAWATSPTRWQAAVWREAIHLVKTGVASVEDVDKAMWAGPGLRWAAMGPTMLFHRRGRRRPQELLRTLYQQLQPLVGRSRRAAS